MPKLAPIKTKTIPARLIAPCGINCRLCRAYIWEKNPCPGCQGDDALKPDYCVQCKIKNCEKLPVAKKGKPAFCFSCESFPCPRLKRLDKRYRTKYGMSLIENLETIKESGIRKFIQREKAKWTCPGCGEMLCAHKPRCLHCGHAWLVG